AHRDCGSVAHRWAAFGRFGSLHRPTQTTQRHESPPATFLFVQTVRHRDYFLPAESGGEKAHAVPPPTRIALLSAGLLVVSLVLVVALAKALTPTVEHGIETAGAPRSAVGIVIAGLVLLPEGLASYRAANANRLQTSMNLALGSALATIGLTIPAV